MPCRSSALPPDHEDDDNATRFSGRQSRRFSLTTPPVKVAASQPSLSFETAGGHCGGHGGQSSPSGFSATLRRVTCPPLSARHFFQLSGFKKKTIRGFT